MINGDGNQELDYIYVDDVVSAMVLAMTGDDKYDVFNVGNGSGVSINRLSELMMDVAGIRTCCEYGPTDFTSGSSRVASTRKFDNRFGLQIRVPLTDGLRRTFEWIVSFEVKP